VSASLRSEVVETARAMRAMGLVVATQGNVSARDGDRVLITPAGLDYDAMTPGDVVALGQSCGLAPSSEWRVHAAIYAARPDVAAIVHTHSPHATRWATDGEGDVPIAPFAETATDELAEHAVRALGDGDAVLLARHGVVGVGASLGEALRVCEDVERRARTATP
jgi:L-fuculose-phosphate aldolase